MRHWTSTRWYEARPWVWAGLGSALALGMFAWSLHAGTWAMWRSLLLLAGAAGAVAGGAVLQLRQEYRARSRWRRETGE